MSEVIQEVFSQQLVAVFLILLFATAVSVFERLTGHKMRELVEAYDVLSDLVLAVWAILAMANVLAKSPLLTSL